MTDARTGYALILDRLLELYPSSFVESGNKSIHLGYRKVAHIAHGWYIKATVAWRRYSFLMRRATPRKPPTETGAAGGHFLCLFGGPEFGYQKLELASRRRGTNPINVIARETLDGT
jgi:hypothetical protein